MATINIDSIMAKVNTYFGSAGGKKKVDHFIKEKRISKNGKLSSGSYVVTLEDMQKLAEDLILILKEEASSSKNNLPKSVLDHFDSLDYTMPEQVGGDDGLYVVDVYFKDDLSRMSLRIASGPREGQRTGPGIKNIVSLYDTGYRASDYVYGFWYDHEDAGIIQSRKKLEGKYFIERAVETFNRKYSGVYNVEAKITASHDFYSLNSLIATFE